MLEKLALLPILIASTTNNPSTEVINQGFTIKNESSIQIMVPFNHQVDDLDEANKLAVGGTACGPTTLTMVLRHRGVETNVNEVLDKLPTAVYVKHVGFYELYKGSEYFDKASVQINQNPTAIYEALNQGNPVILNIQNYDGLYGHAVVVTGIRGYTGTSAKSLIVHDPFKGPYREFKYINNDTLQQPEGFYNPIGHKKPFYII